MTLNETVQQKVAEWRPATRGTLHIPDAGSAWSVAITAERCEDLGCLIWEVGVATTAAPADRTLASWAHQIAESASGLLETLKVVEIDPVCHQAILRSDASAINGDQLDYYEVHLHGTSRAIFQRYRASRQGKPHREQILFTLTREALAKLAGAMAGHQAA